MNISSKNNKLERNDVGKVQKNISLNYWLTEYNNCFLGLVTGFFFFSMMSIPFGVMSLEYASIITFVMFTVVCIAIGMIITTIIFMGIVQPVINRQNRRLIEKEKLLR